ncbi:MAG: hybrid sensor histidine kinase/response regulator [Anaerolineae bacterium]|nr:hybrid sensor histidine kinase/response regulator [Anaerolineae bacterium]
MAESDAARAALLAAEQQVDLHQSLEEPLAWLYAATSALGMALVLLNYVFPTLWRGGVLGMLLLLVPFPLYWLVGRRYRLRVWMLLGLWLASGGAAVLWLAASTAPCLLILPVALAVLFVGAPAGLLTAIAASLVLLGAAFSSAGFRAADGVIAVGTLWGMLGIAWAALGPIHASARWSWLRYEQARGQAEQARTAQADLKQALKDLAEASVQMARLNQLLGAARRAAEEAERAKAEFVANVSHELRTPLNMIIGFSEMMLRNPKAYGRTPAALKADLAVILRNSQHLNDLIDDVLDLSQIEAGQMALTRERVALVEIVDSAVEAIQPLFASKSLYLATEVPEEVTVYCDRTRMREVLLNLLSNAGRFTERGGVRVRARVEGQEVVVSVADTGPGIAPEDQGRLFQPFQQADGSIRRRYGGSGLGLAISKHFVEMHGGRMWLESERGRGTTISFSLAVEPPAPSDGAYQRWLSPEWEYRQRVRQSAAPAVVARPRLVVVEKGTLLQRLLRRYLENVEIEAVSDLEEAGLRIARHPAQGLLVNDLSVGQALDRIRQSALLPYGIPALVCSLPGEEEAAQSLGVAGYLVKPISQETLLSGLDRLGLARGTVLIVDDELDAIQLFWRMLTSSGRGYRVLTAGNGEQALSILRSERPDAMLLDLVMPAMDGFRLLALREEESAWRDVPVIVMSARDPGGQPIVADAIGITRGGGLSTAQLLAYIGALGSITYEMAGASSQAERQAPPATPLG